MPVPVRLGRGEEEGVLEQLADSFGQGLAGRLWGEQVQESALTQPCLGVLGADGAVQVAAVGEVWVASRSSRRCRRASSPPGQRSPVIFHSFQRGSW
ncbi:hypothetical protein ACQPXT_40570 [Streptomyces sp. CA-100214]